MDIPTASGETEELGNAIFSKYPIVNSRAHKLSEEHARLAVQADIDISGTILHVFCTHLKHTHQKPMDVQNLQAKNLIKALPSDHVIVMGDFNATPESEPVKMLGAVLSNTDKVLGPTWSVYPEGCSVCKPQALDTRLDYIFTSKDIKTSSFKIENSKGSDHLPLSVQVELS
jgi:endonuclease/exonuclease/phosphatase family metal-dependent hydrolase